jgi:biopolymer transport protein TolQ
MRDLSIINLFWSADPIVKGVMGFLALASILSWAIVIDKIVRIAFAAREAREMERLANIGDLSPGKPLSRDIMEAGLGEWRDVDDTETRAERRARIERAMRGAVAADLHRMEKGLPLLATVGSTAPFIGLFGTVWGIMNSFASIALSQDTSLAVVAPGIAEALFATALGLVAAIPAVMAYNKFATDLGRLSHRFGASVSKIGNELARSAPLDTRRQAAE